MPDNTGVVCGVGLMWRVFFLDTRSLVYLSKQISKHFRAEHQLVSRVSANVEDAVCVFELKVHPTDLGKAIGRQGRTAKSIRTILGAAGVMMKKRLTLEILE
jgi:predicted RNA-binding protein YlqC (UPF0109 family)